MADRLDAKLVKSDPFWQRMEAMWARLDASGYVPRSTEEMDA
jgi:hypothetical protein